MSAERPATGATETPVRQWTKSDLLGLTILLNRKGDTELSDKIFQFQGQAKGGANAVVEMPDNISRMFERLWNGEELPE